jgi:non-heme Fe2+,alpha-ketoglutarate-dependent halogenase
LIENGKERLSNNRDVSNVEEMERDLAFHRCENDQPISLSRSQIDGFNEYGYVTDLDVFNADKIADVRSYFDDLLDRVLASGKDSYSISSAHLTHGHVHDLLKEPRIVDIISDLLGENVIGWGAHFFCKMPRGGKRVSWHQDASYWPLTPSKTATMWLAIDDADPENANVRLIPRSHLKGHLTYRMSEDDDNVLNQTVDNAETYGDDPVDITLKAGQASVHSDLLLHGSEANHSDRRRCGLTLRYCAADVRAQMGWQDKGIIVRGSDPSGHWANQSRPEAD